MLGKSFTVMCTLMCIIVINIGKSFSQLDDWTCVIGDGFGDPTQNTVPEMEVFNGLLYASTSPTSPGFAKLYRSTTGDSGTWVDVTPPLTGDKSIHSFCTSTLGDGYIWCATGCGKGAMIYRSQDIDSADSMTWIPIAPRGFSDCSLSAAAPHMVVFQVSPDSTPYLYAGVGSHGKGFKGEVWRIPYNSSDSTAWVRLIDFDTVTSSAAHSVDLISYFYVWNEKVYFGTNGKGQLWESSDGVTFTRNTGVGFGFDDTTNIVISSLEEFNGKLYATTTNMRGGQLWRTADGTTWEAVTRNAFGKRDSVEELRSLRTSFNRLWLTGYTDTSVSKGTPVWWSEDGNTFYQSNIDGFGDTDNNGQNAVTIGFGDYQYFGGPNYTAGGQIWRTRVNSTGIHNSPNKKYGSGLVISSVTLRRSSIVIQLSHRIKRLTIFDFRGRTLKSISGIIGDRVVIERADLSNGYYIISAKGDNRIATKAFCIN